MKKFVFLTAIFAVLVLTLCIVNAQGALLISTNSIDVTSNHDYSETLTLNNTGPYNITNINLTLTPISGFSIDPISQINLSVNETKSVSFILHVGDLLANDYSITINANGLPISNSSTFIVTVQESYCSDGSQGNYITKLTIDSDTDFSVGDTIDITTTTKANRDLDIVIEAQLWDVTTQEELDSTDASDSLNKNEDQDTDLTLTIPYDIEESDDIQLRVKAYEDGHESTQCYEKTKSLDITRESHKISIDQFNLDNDNLQCGEDLSGYVKIANVGRHDEDSITVSVKSTALNLSFSKDIDTLDKGDTDKIPFDFTIPTTIKEGSYTLIAEVSYSDTERSSKTIQISGNCFAPQPGVSLNVQPTSSSFSNETSTFLITVTNTGNVAESYTVSVDGYQSWATLVESPTNIGSLNAGATGTSQFMLHVNNGVSGTQTLNVKVSFAGTEKTQPVQVSISQVTQPAGSTSQLWFEIKHNLGWFILIIVLIIVVIVLIVLLSRKPRREVQPLRRNNKRKK